MEERKRRNFFYYVHGGSHTRVFSINQERPSGYHPRATLPYGNLPYNLKHTLIFTHLTRYAT